MSMGYAPERLAEIDAVEVVNLNELYSNQSKDYIKTAKDAQCIRVAGETAQQIAQLWRQLPPDEQMRCHIPPFGLRFYAGTNF